MIPFMLIGHVIGDFILQTEKIAKEKKYKGHAILHHSVVYGAVMGIIVLMLVKLEKAIPVIVILALSHGIIDFLRIKLEKDKRMRTKTTMFLCDQLFHIMIIVMCYYGFSLHLHAGALWINLNGVIGADKVNAIMSTSLLYLIVMKPSAIVVKQVIGLLTNGEEQPKESSLNNAGYLIGILERILIVTLVLQNAISAISFIIAAKSLARFKQLEDKNFAEKYLVGTLLSTVIAVGCALFLKEWMS